MRDGCGRGGGGGRRDVRMDGCLCDNRGGGMGGCGGCGSGVRTEGGAGGYEGMGRGAGTGGVGWVGVGWGVCGWVVLGWGEGGGGEWYRCRLRRTVRIWQTCDWMGHGRVGVWGTEFGNDCVDVSELAWISSNYYIIQIIK